jgi:glucosamine--fructose-6-phosphate aminotransferase (isomerizing)
VVVLILLAMRVATIRGTLTDYDRLRLVESLENLPEAVEEVLKYANVMRNVAKSYLAAPRTLFIGRGYCVPIADEGTLKLQEIGYVDAAAYSAGALKHGPLALVEDVIPVIAIALSGTASDKTLNSVQEVVARSGHIIGIVTKGSAEEELMRKLAKVLISLPNTAEELSPILAAPLVQLYAYYSGVLRKHNVDRPRNLAKSVTVE